MGEKQLSDVDAAREALRTATETALREKKLPKTKADKIRELRAEIAQFRAQGKSWQEVSNVLAGTLDVSAATIRQVMGAKKSSSTPPKAKPANAATHSGPLAKNRDAPKDEVEAGERKRPFGGYEV